MKAQFLISKRFLRSKSGKKSASSSIITVVAIIGVTLGVMVPVVVLSVMEGFQQEIKSKILGVKGHGLISAQGGDYIDNYEEVIADVKKFDEIIAVNPYNEVQGLVKLGNNYKPALIVGVKPNFFSEDKELAKLFRIEKGERDLSGRYFIMMGEEMASRNLISIGDRVSLLLTEADTINANIKPQNVTTKLVGTFRTGFQEFDNNVIYVSISTLEKVFRRDNVVRSISFKVKDIWDMERIFYSLIAKYGRHFKFYSWKELNYNFFKALALEKTLMYFIVTLILIVAVFNVTSSQLINIIERKKEIGILKTIGMKPIHIAQIFMLQGVYIASIGSVLGGILGLLISWDVATTILIVEWLVNFIGSGLHWIVRLVFENGSYKAIEIFPQGIYYLEGIPSDISFERILLFMVLAVLLSFLTGLFPSYKAARMKPIEVMRYE